MSSGISLFCLSSQNTSDIIINKQQNVIFLNNIEISLNNYNIIHSQYNACQGGQILPNFIRNILKMSKLFTNSYKNNSVNLYFNLIRFYFHPLALSLPVSMHDGIPAGFSVYCSTLLSQFLSYALLQ